MIVLEARERYLDLIPLRFVVEAGRVRRCELVANGQVRETGVRRDR